MATGMVIAVVEKVIAQLCSQELKEMCSMFNYESQLDGLKTTVLTIKSVLLDAESKHQELNNSGRDYIERLKYAAYDVDDLLDEFNTMVQKEKYKKGGKIFKKVRRFFTRTNQFFIAHNMSNVIKSLRSKLDKIAKDREQFGLSDLYVPLKMRAETNSFATEDNIIGRETEKEDIMGMLLGNSEFMNNVEFVTIVGIGGLGKTALAQLVYSDPMIQKTFPLRRWVCVSDDYSLDKIFQRMLGRKDESNIEELQGEVRKLIEGNKYLLVLDDVWNESRDDWDKLKLFLNLGGKGSRVIVTSRSKKVAGVVGDDLMYKLEGLSEEYSWNLFKKIAFKQGEEPTDSNDRFFDIGKDIVKKCANVPLAIRVVGTLLFGQHESKWLSIKSSNLIEIGEGEDKIMLILKYSYYHLEPPLKSCFSYCALFPKDFEISKESLIRLWLALGCLEDPLGSRSEEDVGEEYFSTLLHRCFFQDTEKDDYGEIISCKMHDLIHDLALKVAGKESIMLDSRTCEFNQRISHVSFSRNGCDLLSNSIAQLSELKTSRTFLMVSSVLGYKNLAKSNVTAIFSYLRRLRVLDLHCCWLESLPDTVGNLLHLRYLDLSGNQRLKALPNSITKLINLRVLNLNDTGVRELPRDMKKLVNLRHLYLRLCNYLMHMPPGLDTLTSLHVLTTFVVGDETSNESKIGKLRDLRALANLRDGLIIQFNDNFRCDVTDYEEVELLRLAPLQHLTIRFSDIGAASHETLLGCFQPHCILSTISIEGYKGFKLPKWAESITSSLPHLVSIHLQNLEFLEILPSLSQLRHLKYLKLFGLSNVRFMKSDAVGFPLDDQLIFFPSLEELELVRLPKLKGLWREETNEVTRQAFASSLVVPSFPRLCKLILQHCPNLTAFPSCPKLKSVKLYECHEALALLGRRTAIPCNPTTRSALYLEKLEIDNVGGLDCLFRGLLGGIHELVIENFKGGSLLELAAEEVPRHNIQRLVINSCYDLKSLSGVVEHLTGLQSLTIEECTNLELENNEDGMTVTPWNSLHSLSSMKLFGLPKLLNLPEAFQDLSSLEYLEIGHCKNLEALPEWLNCLTSLQTLFIWKCPKLESLPEAIAHMPSLQSLSMFDNENLRTRCSEPDGKDWPNICHIPNLRID